MRRPIHCALVGAVIALLPFADAAHAAAVKDHPAVTPYAGSTRTRRDDDGFKAYTLVVGVHDKAKTDADAFDTVVAEGNVIRLAYENPKDRSAHEIFTNYREALQKAGFEILFACEVEACGPGWGSSRWGRVTGLRYFTSDMRYLAARYPGGEQPLYVAVLVAPKRHQVEVVEVAAMERGLVSAQGLAEGLLTDGRAVLDGLYFDTDKATLTPESAPALGVIAAFLKERGDLQVYIVGHTDSDGGFEHNMALSRNRAAAVVKALVDDHGIAAARLSPHGVGPLSPAKSNRAAAGKAENRRVEMVER